VTAVTNGTITQTINYDPNGNMTSGLGRNFTWFSFNKPRQISNASANESFQYDTEHARWWKAIPALGGGTLYFDAFGVHAEYLISATDVWSDYISAGGVMVGMRSGATGSILYFHTDNLSSIARITDQTGTVVESDGYDAWGVRRKPDGSADTSTSRTPRGFTGQEELSDFGLVHLNGRIYDPLLARMTSADPVVPDPLNGQAWNRYSYVVNNPLAFTDPSGYCFLGLCGSLSFSTFFKDFGQNLRDHAIIGSIFEIAAVTVAATICTVATPVCAVTAAFLSTDSGLWPLYWQPWTRYQGGADFRGGGRCVPRGRGHDRLDTIDATPRSDRPHHRRRRPGLCLQRHRACGSRLRGGRRLGCQVRPLRARRQCYLGSRALH
jgi:RHS repeat-associated protein